MRIGKTSVHTRPMQKANGSAKHTAATTPFSIISVIPSGLGRGTTPMRTPTITRVQKGRSTAPRKRGPDGDEAISFRRYQWNRGGGYPEWAAKRDPHLLTYKYIIMALVRKMTSCVSMESERSCFADPLCWWLQYAANRDITSNGELGGPWYVVVSVWSKIRRVSDTKSGNGNRRSFPSGASLFLLPCDTLVRVLRVCMSLSLVGCGFSCTNRFRE